MNLAALRDAVRRRAGLPGSDALAQPGDLNEVINEALHAISTDRRWPWLEVVRTFATVGAQDTYATGPQWVETRMVQVQGQRPMRAASRVELESSWGADTSGVPVAFAISGDQLVLRPTPDGAHTVTEVYYRHEADLAADGDTPLMPAWAHGAIVWWATAELHRRTRDNERAELAQQRADDWIRRMRDNARRMTAPARPRVRPGGFV